MQTEDTLPNHMWIVNKAHKKMQKKSKFFKQLFKQIVLTAHPPQKKG